MLAQALQPWVLELLAQALQPWVTKAEILQAQAVPQVLKQEAQVLQLQVLARLGPEPPVQLVQQLEGASGCSPTPVVTAAADM